MARRASPVRPSSTTRKQVGRSGYQIIAPTVITSFDDYATWSNFNDAGVAGSSSDDTTLIPQVANPGEGILLSIDAGSTSAGFGVRKAGFSMDMTNDRRFALKYYFDQDGDLSAGVRLSLRVASAGGVFVDFEEYFLGNSAVPMPRSGIAYIDGLAETSDNTGGTIDWGAITIIGVKMVALAGHSTSQETRCHLDAFYYPVGHARTKVMLTFDDGNDDHYTEVFQGTGDFETAGLVGTCFVNGGTIEDTESLTDTGSKMTTGQLRAMQTAGWDIANHGLEHTNPTTTTVAAAVANYAAGRDWLTQRGLTGAHTVYASPEGGISEALVNAMRAAGAKCYRGTANWTDTNHPRQGAVSTIADSLNNDQFYQLGSATMSVDDFGTAAAILAEIDKASKFGYSIILKGHEFVAGPVGSTQMDVAELTALVAGLTSRINSGQIDVVTMSRFLDELEVQRRPIAATRPAAA